MNTKDREMLELAAKAAGVIPADGGARLYYAGQGIWLSEDAFWNPTEDDAQCLQLARQLGINIDYEDCCAWKRLDDTSMTLFQECWDGDCWATDRGAVLAVAAEMGRLL